MKKIFLILIILFYACNQKSREIEGQPMNDTFVQDYNNRTKVDSLSQKIIIEGDTIAFKELKNIYMISEHSEEFLYFSTVMAEKYNYGPAYQTNYQILKVNKKGTMQKLAVYNLLKSYELGNVGAREELNEMFPEGIPKSKVYWN